MGKIPIQVEKIIIKHNGSETGSAEYCISVREKGLQWKKTFRCKQSDLIRFRDDITEIINNTSLAEKLGIEDSKAKKLENHFNSDLLCKDCQYKKSYACITCIFQLDSPLERKLYLELKKNYLSFQTQFALDWRGNNISVEGKSYDNPHNNFKNVLTVVDFYLEQKGVKICIYTDGHTYHERTEEQAQRDKRIDRKLQEFGFKVLRYTGKDVNENIEGIITEIKKWIK